MIHRAFTRGLGPEDGFSKATADLFDAKELGHVFNPKTALSTPGRRDRNHLGSRARVIAPLVTNSDQVLRHTIFYPYSLALHDARGEVLSLLTESSSYEARNIGQVTHLDVAGTIASKTGVISLFILNRDLSKARDLEIVWKGNAPARVLTFQVLTGGDLKAFDSFQEPRRVVP